MADIWMLEDSAWREGELHRITGGRYTIRRSPSVRAIGGFDGLPEPVWFLDHDLCAAAPGRPCPVEPSGCGCSTGLDFARAAIFQRCDSPDPWPALIIVHSANPVGAARMVDELKHAGAWVQRAPVMQWSALSPSINAAIAKAVEHD